MDILQAVIGLIVAITALIGAFYGVIKIAGNQSKNAFAILQREFDDEKKETGRLRTRVTELEEKREKRTLTIKTLENNIETLTGQVNTLLTQMETMQTHAAQSELREKEKDQEIARLKKENGRVTKQAEQLFDANKDFQAQHVIWEKMIDKFAPEPRETHPEKVQPEPTTAEIVTGAMGGQTTTDKEKPTDD